MEGPGPGQLGLPEQLRRERLVDMERRLAQHRRSAFGVLGLALLASVPSLGWLWLIPLSATVAIFLVTDRLVQASAHAARWAALGWAISPLTIALSVALTGGPESPATAWFALPGVTVAARFELRGVVLGTAWVLVLLFGSTVPVDAGAAFGEPTLLIFPFAGTIAAVILSRALAESERQFRHEAARDPLTGLLNRAALSQRFVELEQHPAPIAFLIGDLDHFKAINDERGHDVGDAVLREAAYAMRDVLRAVDMGFRVGGEEFVVLLPGSGLEEASEVAERLRAEVERCSRPGLRVTMSFGAAAAEGGRIDLGTLYRDADLALYAAKRAGRNRVHLAEPAGDAAVA